MNIEFDCPGCAKHYSVAEPMAGKGVKCKGCGATFPIPAAVPVGAWTKRSEPRPASSSHLSAAIMPGIVGGGIVILATIVTGALSGAGLAVLMLLIGVAIIGGVLVACLADMEGFAWPGIGVYGVIALAGMCFGIYDATTRQSGAASTTTIPSASDSQPAPPATPSTFTTAPSITTPLTATPATTGAAPPADPVTGNEYYWTANFVAPLALDPLPEASKVPALLPPLEPLEKLIKPPGRLSLPEPFAPWIVFAGGEPDQLTIMSLRTGKMVSTRRPINLSQVRFSPGGRYVAAVFDPNKVSVEVWDMSNGTSVLRCSAAAPSSYCNCEFMADDKLVVHVNERDAGPRHLDIWDLKTKTLQQIPLPGDLLGRSPGGKYLLVKSLSGVSILDSATWQQAGELRLNKLPRVNNLPPPAISPLAAAFSPDGASLAIFQGEGTLERPTEIRIVDVRTAGFYGIRVQGTLESSDYTDLPPRLVWLPDGNGFLLYRIVMVSRTDGKLLKHLPFDDRVHAITPTQAIWFDDKTRRFNSITLEHAPFGRSR